MKILILGAGGIGGYFGAHLIRCGADVTYLLRAKRKSLIDENGLRIESPHGDFVVYPKTVSAETIQPGFDLVILAAKAYDLQDALCSLAPVLDTAVVLPFLNGFDHLDVLDEKLGRERVMGGVAHIAATIKADGTVQQLSDLHVLTVGARHDAHSAVADEFVALCEKAPFKCRSATNIEQVLWDKWVFLATLAGMTTSCRAAVGDIVATPLGSELTRQMYAECCAVAEAFDYPVNENARSKALEMLTQKGSTFTASMLRDLLAGSRTEADHILGGLIDRAHQKPLSVPLLGLAYTHMLTEQKAD